MKGEENDKDTTHKRPRQGTPPPPELETGSLGSPIEAALDEIWSHGLEVHTLGYILDNFPYKVHPSDWSKGQAAAVLLARLLHFVKASEHTTLSLNSTSPTLHVGTEDGSKLDYHCESRSGANLVIRPLRPEEEAIIHAHLSTADGGMTIGHIELIRAFVDRLASTFPRVTGDLGAHYKYYVRALEGMAVLRATQGASIFGPGWRWDHPGSVNVGAHGHGGPMHHATIQYHEGYTDISVGFNCLSIWWSAKHDQCPVTVLRDYMRDFDSLTVFSKWLTAKFAPYGDAYVGTHNLRLDTRYVSAKDVATVVRTWSGEAVKLFEQNASCFHVSSANPAHAWFFHIKITDKASVEGLARSVHNAVEWIPEALDLAATGGKYKVKE